MDNNSGAAGFSADTEILTRGQGWIAFDQLTCLDEIATRSPHGRFEWHHPERVSVERYDGDMVHLHSRTTDLMVTPGTRLLYMERHRTRRNGANVELPYTEESRPACTAVGARLSLVATSRWEPPAPRRSVAFTATRAQTYGGRLANFGSDFAATSADFASFMGMYLAEGNISAPNQPGYYVWIWQKTAGKGFEEFQGLLNHLLGREVPWQAKKGFWHFSHKALWEHLQHCGSRAWTKRAPLDVLDLAADDLERFWRFYWLGDGTLMKSPGRQPLEVISTTSREMAGALQEILQKLGGWSMIQTVDYSKYDTIAATSHLTYRLVRRASDVAFATNIDRVSNGVVVGIIGSGRHAVYVRRNYRPVWAGGAIR